MAHSTPASRTVRSAVAMAVTAVLPLIGLFGGTAPALAGSAAADGPGALSHYDLARKDCLGTARNTSSKVWYTVANGVLSDVYYPTLDNTNVETLQYIVTDGSSFTDLQSRDMSYTVASPDRSGMVCRVTSTARSGKYRLRTTYVTDPDRNVVLMRTRLQPLVRGAFHLYVRFDATVNGNGGGGSANGGGDSATVDTSMGHPIAVSSDTNTVSNAVNRDYATPVFAAVDGPFDRVESGFVGQASDGLTQLDAAHTLTRNVTDATGGNVVQTAAIRSGRRNVTLALGFGATRAAAVGAAERSRAREFGDVREAYEATWARYDAHLVHPPAHLGGASATEMRRLQALYWTSANAVKASEDKTFSGAIVASIASPWGQAVSAGDPANLYFGSYREVFSRDLYEAWTGLVADGDLATARDAVLFLFRRQQLSDGSMPRNSLLNGRLAPDSFGVQLDEAAYPILMADQLGMTGAGLYANHIRPAANFIISHGPAFGVERWEEQNGFSPSTIAAEIAGLVAAAHLARANGDTSAARVYLGVADDYQRSIEGWAVTTTGPLSASPYFIRLSKTGDPNAAISYNVGNGGPTLDQRSIIDAGFLELVRLGEKRANEAAVVNSIPVVDATIRDTTVSGPGWHRYNGDGYGDGANDGHPWAPTGRGTGHLWPILSVERGEYDLLTGTSPSARTILSSLVRFATGVGLIPEQDWEQADLAASPFGTDPTVASIGFRNGRAAGSAAPLTWAAGAYVRLFRDIVAGRLLDRPASTTDRYIRHPVGATTLTLTTPADLSAVTASPVVVAGTTAPGNAVFVAATNIDHDSATTIVKATIAGNGSFSLSVPVTGGTTVFNAVAVAPNGDTAHVERSVVFDFTPGTVVLDVTDPAGDDAGPGNYAYPTSGDFHAGAFDLEDFRVIVSPDGATTTFKVQTRDLSPTFGSPEGAQLVDVYVHDPAAVAADTSTAASFPQRNYQIASASAWSRLLEVQGFGQRYINAQGTGQGTIAISANAISRFITFSVPTTSLGGTPGSGWGFTVVLTGQDGFSPDQARGFAPTPQPFAFGVCATASADPHCTADPNTVPKAVDVITPQGVSQSNELDYTLHNPVVITDVTVP
jgi:glucoamylase